MSGLADTTGMPDVRSRRVFFSYETVCQDQPLEMALESALNFYHSEMRAARGRWFGIRYGRVFSLAFLRSSSVAPFRGPNSDRRKGVCFATSRQASEIIAPEAPYSRVAFLDIRRDSPSEGDGCMKDIDHPIRHPSVHLRISRRVRNRRSCTCRDDQFGRGQNTGLGWGEPPFFFPFFSVPKVIHGVAPAQLRVDRAECFVRAAFRSRGPQ
jgi:hypothetical protein